MPRFANLKGSMNPFDNNKPVLSSSERLKNKRNKTIYQTQKLNYQTTKNCGNRNVKYYDNGTVRSTNSYKMNMKLSRGAVLCEDCEGNGTLCENIFDKNDLTKVTMGNSTISTLNLETGLGIFFNQINETNIIIADISGVWGTKTKNDPYIYTPYGYATNLITVPRNLNGSGNYMNYVSIKTFIIYEGPIGWGPNASTPTGPSDVVNTDPLDSRYFEHLLNKYCIFFFSAGFHAFSVNSTGQVLKICPIGKKLMTNTIWGPPPAPGSIFPVDFFRVYVEITLLKGNLWQGSISPSVDKTNFKPQFKPNTISNFRIEHDGAPAFGMFSAWAANFGPPAYLGANIEMKVTIDQNNLDTCSVSQIRGNATKQNYMSCLG